MSSNGESDSEHDTPHKRQRLSSPTYDEQFEMSQQEVAVFDAFDQLLSQQRRVTPPRLLQSSPQHSKRKRSDALVADDLELERHSPVGGGNVGTTTVDGPSAFTKASDLPVSAVAAGFTHAARRSSQENPFLSPSSSDGPIDEGALFFGPAHAPPGGIMFQSAKDFVIAPPENDDDWLTAAPPPGAFMGFQSAKKLPPQPAYEIEHGVPESSTPATGPTTAATLRDLGPQPAPDGEKTVREQGETPAFVGFQTGSSLLGAKNGSKKTSWSAPSAEALAKAAERMKKWQAEIDAELDEPNVRGGKEPAEIAISSTPPLLLERTVLGAVENAAEASSSQPFSQNSSQSLSQPGVPDTPTPIRAEFKPARLSISSPLANRKPFKSPLISKATASSAATSYAASPLNPNRTTVPGFAKPSAFRPPLKTAPPLPEAGPSTSFFTPAKKVLGSTPRRPTGSPVKKPTFVTPFKPGMRPGEAGRVQLASSQRAGASVGPVVVTDIAATPGKKDKGKGRAVYFDLTPPESRKTLANSGLRPQSYTEEELEAFGTDIAHLSGMTPCSAYYYRFYRRSEDPSLSVPPSQSQAPENFPAMTVLGPEEALLELKERGCRLATAEWVDNHYGLILWKLAGMVALEPQREYEDTRRRWCWEELRRQFLYRYERELNSGVRPPIRLIASQDKPAGLPMVLCVSRICPPDEYDADGGTTGDPGPLTVNEDGEQIPPRPIVELTDGWYRVRAEVDETLVRAIRRGALRIGMKVGVVGAKLLNPRSEPFEILEAPWKNLKSDSSFALRISGNGCHLAPWYAKLGFQAEPFIATLPSLSPNGGLIPVMDVRIVKTFPIAYMECFTTPEGKTWSPPMKEPEEVKARNAWISKRDMEAQRIREDIDKSFDTLEKCADRLDIRAGAHFNPTENDSPPDTIDDLLYALEEACSNSAHHETTKDIISRTSHKEAGWLARALREKLAKDQENIGDEITQRLEETCPPRSVRSFRVVAVEDAQTTKRPKQFTAQITIWEVLTAYVSEDGIPGDFRVGERFVVTNLDPNNTDAWMPRQDGAVLYLIARRDTRWKKIRQNKT